MCVYVRVCLYACVRTAVMFLVNASPPKPLDIATSNFQVQRSHDVEGILGNNSCDPDPKFKVRSQIMYFLVNAPPP